MLWQLQAKWIILGSCSWLPFPALQQTPDNITPSKALPKFSMRPAFCSKMADLTRLFSIVSYWVLSTSWAQRAAHSSENSRVLLVLNYNRVITIRFIEPIQTNYNFGYSCCSCRSFAFSLKSYLPIDPMVVFVPPSNVLHAFILITKQPVMHKHAGHHSAEYSQIHHSRYPTFHVPNHI